MTTEESAEKPGANPEKGVGVIGLGQMGGPMAKRLLDAGYTVTVHDVNEAAAEALRTVGARVAATVAEVAAAAEVVLLSLPSPQIVSEVVAGPGGLCATGGPACVIDLSTTGLTTSQQANRALTGAGIDFIDAPVSGGARGAVNGTLTVMVATPQPVFDRYRHLLDPLARRVFYIGGSPGQAQVMKLVNNMISAGAMVATTEGIVLGAKAGLDLKLMLEVLNSSTGRNSHTEDKFPNYVLPRTFDFGFTIGLLRKDVQLGLEMAKSLNVPVMVSALAQQVWGIAEAEGGPGRDMTSLIQSYEAWTGFVVGGSPAEDDGPTERAEGTESP
jgi:3-hydroxyisobutyrate dehydrogenase-like beta-hydroxyacid dehydrogenase